MRESKQEQFHIGGTYRQQNGAIVTVFAEKKYQGQNPEFYPGLTVLKLSGGGNRNVHGKCCSFVGTPLPYLDLVPGELHQVDGQWIALGVEKPASMTPTLDKLEQATKEYWDAFVGALPAAAEVLCFADAAMIARDGPAKPTAVVIPKPAEPTAKPAISGLQRVYSSTHLLGSYR